MLITHDIRVLIQPAGQRTVMDGVSGLAAMVTPAGLSVTASPVGAAAAKVMLLGVRLTPLGGSLGAAQS